ncbi:hypothetical protein niasHT_034921 [Heterodera trifolii]|uniref:Uncharacterized protein n=1 Tax=Heterodera trifolii TaxID=157864 RepID=A0ABD2I236_9BILA
MQRQFEFRPFDFDAFSRQLVPPVLAHIQPYVSQMVHTAIMVEIQNLRAPVQPAAVVHPPSAAGAQAPAQPTAVVQAPPMAADHTPAHVQPAAGAPALAQRADSSSANSVKKILLSVVSVRICAYMAEMRHTAVHFVKKNLQRPNT